MGYPQPFIFIAILWQNSRFFHNYLSINAFSQQSFESPFCDPWKSCFFSRSFLKIAFLLWFFDRNWIYSLILRRNLRFFSRDLFKTNLHFFPRLFEKKKYGCTTGAVRTRVFAEFHSLLLHSLSPPLHKNISRFQYIFASIPGIVLHK